MTISMEDKLARILAFGGIAVMAFFAAGCERGKDKPFAFPPMAEVRRSNIEYREQGGETLENGSSKRMGTIDKDNNFSQGRENYNIYDERLFEGKPILPPELLSERYFEPSYLRRAARRASKIGN